MSSYLHVASPRQGTRGRWAPFACYHKGYICAKAAGMRLLASRFGTRQACVDCRTLCFWHTIYRFVFVGKFACCPKPWYNVPVTLNSSLCWVVSRRRSVADVRFFCLKRAGMPARAFLCRLHVCLGSTRDLCQLNSRPRTSLFFWAPIPPAVVSTLSPTEGTRLLESQRKEADRETKWFHCPWSL
jgi:hypothetical protein